MLQTGLGDFSVAASTDDVHFSTVVGTLTYYDPSRTARVASGQQLAISTVQAGFLKLTAVFDSARKESRPLPK